MNEVLDEVDVLLNMLDNSDFVRNMKRNRNIIINNKLINTSNIKELYKNEIINEYVSNQNILDYHIYYFNNKLNKLIDNKTCR